MQLVQALSQDGPLLADGAMGTTLFDMGLGVGEAPELWIERHPERIAMLHRAFVDAGADLILTNSFGGNARRLILHELQDRCAALNAQAARLARAAADRAGRPVVVGGSVGPTGELLAPFGPLTEEEAAAIFVEQIEGLAEGGVDVIWIETMAAIAEMRAAATAATRVGLPFTLTASFHMAGRTACGISPRQFADFAAGLPIAPTAIGANCGTGTTELLVSILAIRERSPAIPLIAKANAGLPTRDGDHFQYPSTPSDMADYARRAMGAGAAIIGGCCGTSPAHLAAMRRALDRGRDPGSGSEAGAPSGPLQE